jgi:hypothetical protein
MKINKILFFFFKIEQEMMEIFNVCKPKLVYL